MADPRTVDPVLWCLCADAVADKIDPSTVCEGARELKKANYAHPIAMAAYQVSKGKPEVYAELTRVLFLWGGLGDDAGHYLLPELRKHLKKRAALAGAKAFVEDRSFTAVKARLTEQYRFGAETHYRLHKEKMAAVLHDWLNENRNPKEWDELDLAMKLAAVWGKDRDRQP